MKRRDFCRGAAGVALGAGATLGSGLLPLMAQVTGPESEQIGEIYELQAAFHRAKTTQDIDLMMSLWDPNGILNVQGDPNSPYVGFDQLKAFWLSSGSFTHRRFSLVPSFKTRINVSGNQASLYFECHDIGDYDLPTRFHSLRYVPGWHPAEHEREMGFFEHDGREVIASVGGSLLLPLIVTNMPQHSVRQTAGEELCIDRNCVAESGGPRQIKTSK